MQARFQHGIRNNGKIIHQISNSGGTWTTNSTKTFYELQSIQHITFCLLFPEVSWLFNNRLGPIRYTTVSVHYLARRLNSTQLNRELRTQVSDTCVRSSLLSWVETEIARDRNWGYEITLQSANQMNEIGMMWEEFLVCLFVYGVVVM